LEGKFKDKKTRERPRRTWTGDMVQFTQKNKYEVNTFSVDSVKT